MTQAQFSNALSNLDQGGRERLTRIVRDTPYQNAVVLSFPLDDGRTNDRALTSAGNAFNPWMPQG